MTTLELITTDYELCVECKIFETKYEWAASSVFNLTTYDVGLDELFVKKILEVCKVILNGTNFEYIKDEINYHTYILVCQLLKEMNWIDWGTSIRGAWFNDFAVDEEVSPLFVPHTYEDRLIYPSKENIRELIKFVEEEDAPKKVL